MQRRKSPLVFPWAVCFERAVHGRLALLGLLGLDLSVEPRVFILMNQGTMSLERVLAGKELVANGAAGGLDGAVLGAGVAAPLGGRGKTAHPPGALLVGAVVLAADVVGVHVLGEQEDGAELLAAVGAEEVALLAAGCFEETRLVGAEKHFVVVAGNVWVDPGPVLLYGLGRRRGGA